MLKDEKQPFWQAVAAAILGQWAASPDVSTALIAALGHTDPLVRENAARALEPLAHQHDAASRDALARLLADAIRAVRIRAVWALRNSINPQSPPGIELQAYLDQNADQPLGAMQQGLYHLARNETTNAIMYFKKAIAWDPNSAPFHDTLAVALSMNGQTREAIAQLQEAMRIDPRESEYPFKLALAYNETNQLDKTIELLNQTLNLNPRHARAAYNLGLAYSKANQPDEAISALRRAEAIDPNNAQIPYARATVHLQLKQKDDARQAAQRALEIDPANTAAMQLLRTLGQ